MVKLFFSITNESSENILRYLCKFYYNDNDKMEMINIIVNRIMERIFSKKKINKNKMIFSILILSTCK